MLKVLFMAFAELQDDKGFTFDMTGLPDRFVRVYMITNDQEIYSGPIPIK